MFQTLQGEGPYRGEPAFFVRFSKCNLACSFCDTYFDDGDWYTIPEVEAHIEKSIQEFYSSHGMTRPLFSMHEYLDRDIIDLGDVPIPSRPLIQRKKDMVLVITGGEPMLQKNIVPFLEHFKHIFKKTQIESNGLIFQDIPKETTLVVSPKCSEKKGKPIKYLNPNERVLERADCLKFVMEAPNHEEPTPYSSIPDWAFDWREETGNPIYISPMNIYNSEPQKSKNLRSRGQNSISIEERSTVDEVISFWEPGLLNMEENQKNHEYAAQYCVQHGCILNLQVHLYASLA